MSKEGFERARVSQAYAGNRFTDGDYEIEEWGFPRLAGAVDGVALAGITNIPRQFFEVIEISEHWDGYWRYQPDFEVNIDAWLQRGVITANSPDEYYRKLQSEAGRFDLFIEIGEWPPPEDTGEEKES